MLHLLVPNPHNSNANLPNDVVAFSESVRIPVRLILTFWRFTLMLYGAGAAGLSSFPLVDVNVMVGLSAAGLRT